MTRIVTTLLAAALTATAFTGFAQVHHEPRPMIQASPQARAILGQQVQRIKPANKTTQTGERLIASYFLIPGGYEDSIRYYYSGTHGSTLAIWAGTGYQYDFFDFQGISLTAARLNNIYAQQNKRALICDSLFAQDVSSSTTVSWRKSFLYNANNQLMRDYDNGITAGGAPFQQAKDTFFYDAGMRLIGIHYWYHDTAAAVWIDSAYIGYTYDAAGNLTTDSLSLHTGNSWTPTNQDVYTYDAAGNILSDSSSTWTGSSWAGHTGNHYQYDAANRLAVQLYYNDQAGIGNPLHWVDSFFYTGNAMLPSQNREINYVGTAAPSYQRNFYFMSSPVQIDSSSIEKLNATTLQWQQVFNVVTAYNSFGDATQQRISLGYLDRWYYELYDPTGIAGTGAQPLQCLLYPNPANTELTINAGTQIPDVVVIKDITGKQVQRMVPATATTVLSIAGLMPGIYLVTVQAGMQANTQRVTIVR